MVRARRAKEDHDSSGRLPGGGGPGVTPAKTTQLRSLQETVDMMAMRNGLRGQRGHVQILALLLAAM